MKPLYDVVIIGAGAAGMMCAIEAGKRGRIVMLVDHAKKIAEKIRISGGGRCNFTNTHSSPQNYLSGNSHFCKSALKQFTQQDFIDLVKSHNISYHEKKLGQLFCDKSSQEIIDMLLSECQSAGIQRDIGVRIDGVEFDDGVYTVKTSSGNHTCKSLVIATGGLSIPKLGASKFGYDVARQFGINVHKTRPGLVPLNFQSALLERCKELAGLSVEASISCRGVSFSEGLLFTHRGLSGPSILQISSYWHEGDAIIINLAPDVDVLSFLKGKKINDPKQEVQNSLSDIMPKRLAQSICDDLKVCGRMADLPDKTLTRLAHSVSAWSVKPSGTEGYRTAEVTLGGIDTGELSSKTMEAKNQPGLYFIGEVVDVTGHLGGFNFQWAWSSGYVAGQNA